MTTMKPIFKIALGVVFFLSVASAALFSLSRADAQATDRDYYPSLAEDLNADPNVLELNLVAGPATVDLTGDGLNANVLAFNGDLPGPLLRLKLGDTRA